MPNQYTKLKNEIEQQVDNIKKLLEDNYSVSEISNMLGYKYAAVYNCIRRNNLKHLVNVSTIGKSRTFKKRYVDYNNTHKLNREVLHKLYNEEKKDLYEIAKLFNVSPSGVLYRMRKCEIKTRDNSEANKLLYEKKPELREVHRKNANEGLTGIFRRANNYLYTWIERDFENFCIENSIPYQRLFQITKDTHRYDFLIYDKLIVELDGVYWHNKPKQKMKDMLHEQYAKDNGFDVIRFTDVEIKRTKGKCFELVKNFN